MKQVFDVPERGDIVRIVLSSRDGQVRPPVRPAVVVSPQAYNARVGLAVLCPIVSRITGYPFEVSLPPGLSAAGAVLADQALSLDWRTHRAEKIGALPANALEEVLGKLRSLLG